jgi:hypothetical protein
MRRKTESWVSAQGVRARTTFAGMLLEEDKLAALGETPASNACRIPPHRWRDAALHSLGFPCEKPVKHNERFEMDSRFGRAGDRTGGCLNVTGPRATLEISGPTCQILILDMFTFGCFPPTENVTFITVQYCSMEERLPGLEK